MNSYQALWWRQSVSDFGVFVQLRTNGVPPCHSLHYLQMATEKLAKAFFWRSGTPPPRSHAGFVQFMRFLGSVREPHQDRVARLFHFRRFSAWQSWIRRVLPIAYQLEAIAPALANDGPNPEYPWPHRAPIAVPLDHEFEVWTSLTSSGQGRELLRVISIAAKEFAAYADA